MCYSVYLSTDKTWWGRQSACTRSGIQIWHELWAFVVPTSLCASYRNIANTVTCLVSWKSKLRNLRKLILQSSKDIIDTLFVFTPLVKSAIYDISPSTRNRFFLNSVINSFMLSVHYHIGYMVVQLMLSYCTARNFKIDIL